MIDTLTKRPPASSDENWSFHQSLRAENHCKTERSPASSGERSFVKQAQQSCERGFGFLKDPLFFASSIYIKSPERIETMAMIMGLCLLVYTLAQRQIRAALSSSKSTIKNQLGKSINNPTMRWVFQCFQSIHLIKSNDERLISNMTDYREYILSFLPPECRYYYQFWAK